MVLLQKEFGSINKHAYDSNNASLQTILALISRTIDGGDVWRGAYWIGHMIRRNQIRNEMDL